MKFLVLSCNMGEGHNSAGKAIYEKFVKMGIECEFADTLAIAGMKVSNTINNLYVGMTTTSPGMFGVVYSLGRAVSNFDSKVLRCKSPVYAANTLYRDKLADYIKKGGYNAVITPHLFPAECLTSLHYRKMLDTPFVNIATDYTCIPFWEETKPDYFVIPHNNLADDFCSKGIPKDILLPFGIPVSERFNQKKDKAEARLELGLNTDAPILLLMLGSMGHGKPDMLAEALTKKFEKGTKIIILCGRNEKLRAQLSDKFKDNDNIILQQFTDKVNVFMDAADIVFTKPGGLTSTEAAVKNTLLVHTSPIPGCESINIKFFRDLGLSVSCERYDDYEGTADAAYNLFYDKAAQQRMLEAQRVNINPHAAEDICNFVINRFS